MMIFNKYNSFIRLLLCFGIADVLCRKTAGGETCKQPKPVENAVLRQEYANIDKFNDTEIVEYDCALGYSIEGRSRERHCNKGRWSNVRFRCTLITCPYMDHPEHGRRKDANNGAGQYARFECDIGYTLKGPDKLLCRTDGRWSPSNPPTCAPILCPELPRIQHGRIFQDTSDGIRNNYESVAEYTCNRGYLLNGNKQRYTRKCQADGTWTGEQPFCDIPRCEHITQFYGGDVLYFGDRKRWSQAFYSCDDAYSLTPSNVEESECTDNLKWEPSPPQCLKKAKVEKPDHSYVRGTKDVLLHGDSYKLYCYRGYDLYRDRFLEEKRYETIRNNNGTLVPQVPICEEERCDAADLSKAVVRYENGSMVNSKILSQTKVSLSCQNGYDYYRDDKPMDKPVIRKCERGKIRRAPTCEEARCLFSGNPSNEHTTHRRFGTVREYYAPGQYIYPGEKIEVVCSKDYELFVESTEAYLETFTSGCSYGQFDETSNHFPICLEKRCHFNPNKDMCLSTTDNGVCRRGEFKVQSGSNVTISCKEGYKLYRSEDGSSVEVNEEASILCSKGTYFKGYKCIPDGVLKKIKHYAEKVYDNGAEVYDEILDRLTCRFSMFGFTPCEDPCLVPEIPFGFAKSKNFGEKISGEADHGKQITIQCDHGFVLSKRMTSTCKFGEWDNDQFPTCSPKPCPLSLKSGTLFWVDSELLTEEDGATRTFSNGTRLNMECEHGYEMNDMKSRTKVENIRRDSTCDLGKWTHEYSCKPEKCSVPTVKAASLLTKATESYEHLEEIEFVCDLGHHFVENHLVNEKKNIKATCKLGNWSQSIPSACHPDSCKLTLQDGSKYYLTNHSDEITTAEWFEHGTDILLQCMQDFDTFDKNGKLVNETNSSPVVTCHQGQWKNIHTCKKQCIAVNVTNGWLVSNGENITADQTFSHGEIVTVKCEKFEDYDVDCENGKWRGFMDCIDDVSITTVVMSSASDATTDESSTTTKEMTTAEKSKDPTSPHESDSSEESKGEMDDDVSDGNQHTNEHTEGCQLSSDERYIYTMYTDGDDSKEIKPGSTISSGTTLTVSCTTLDLYDYYTSYEDYVYDEPEPTITCVGNELTHLDLDCPEVIPDECLNLENGKVVKTFGQYDVSCNKGFSLDLIIPEKSLCTCEDGELISVIGRQKPACIPDDCVLPYEIDDRLSVTDRSRVVSLSGGSTVKNGGHVYLNCSKVDEQKYEPVNRRFKCESGQWIEDERDPNWKLGYNGRFPECRAAICEPNCQNGGVCYKDGLCRCKHLTEGERCETVLCDDKCAANGGTCLAGDCHCPKGRFGPNCEKEGCSLPADGVKPKIRKIIYKPGEKISDFDCDLGYMLSSQDGMTCKDDGSWSNIVYCIKAAFYLIRVKTVDASFWKGAGTDAKVYIYLHGQHGKTRRIYLRGNFKAGDLDETRVMARDVRPITEVVVGRDGRIIRDDWYLEFASIYVESVNEYYVFRPVNHIWITDTDDVTLPRQGNCISTFDSGRKWYPKWKQISQKVDIGSRDTMTLRGCQQKCTELTSIYCQSVVYNIYHKSCWGFAVSSENFFSARHGTWNSPVYLRKCK